MHNVSGLGARVKGEHLFIIVGLIGSAALAVKTDNKMTVEPIQRPTLCALICASFSI